jgi:hypothetical protein
MARLEPDLGPAALHPDLDSLVAFPGIIVYIILWVVMPKSPV